jgi:hypothetical protein
MMNYKKVKYSGCDCEDCVQVNFVDTSLKQFIQHMSEIDDYLINNDLYKIVTIKCNDICIRLLSDMITYIITNDLYLELREFKRLESYLQSIEGHDYYLESDNHHDENENFQNIRMYLQYKSNV